MAGLARTLTGWFSGAASVMPALPFGSVPIPTFTEERSLENPAVALNSEAAYELFSYGSSSPALSGVTISPETALKVSALYRAVNVIGETVAMLPKGVFQETNDGRVLSTDDPLQVMFLSSPDDYMTWYDFMHTLIVSTLLHGNGYALIERGPYAKPTGLRFLAPGECSPIYQTYGRNRSLYYYVFGELVEKRDIIHIRCLGSDGIIGKSPIALFRESIGLARAAEEYGARFFGQGGNMSGTLETDQAFKDEGAIKRLRSQFAERIGGMANSHKPLILEQGMKYNRIAIPPDDAQFIETRSFQIEDIARIYGVPQHKLNKLDRSTNNNIEHQAKEFVTDTILPWTERIRQEFERKLIAEADKATKEVVFDFDFLLRGDSAARATYYQGLFNTGSISPNEIRRKENMNRLEGLDDTFLQLNTTRVTTDSHQTLASAPPVANPKTPATA